MISHIKILKSCMFFAITDFIGNLYEENI